MKTSLLALTLLTTSFASAAEPICAAQKHEEVSYVSSLNYEVACSDGSTFKTPVIFTSILLPIPYNWGSVSRKKLYKMMDARGYPTPQVAKLARPGILIFSKSKTAHHYCSVEKSESKPSGVSGRAPTFDAWLNCENEGDYKTFNGITQSELDREMQLKGFRRVVQYGQTDIFEN